MKNLEWKRNYFIEETNKRELMSKKHKKGCMDLNYTEYLLMLASVFTGYVSITALAFLAGIPKH